MTLHILLSPLSRRMVAALFVAATATVASTAARADDRVTGSGKVQAEARTVGSFQAIAVHGPVNLVLRQGSREGIEVRADDNVLPLIETRVVQRGGVPTLEVGTRSGASYSTRQTVTATIDLIKLEAIAISGDGEVLADALQSPTLKIGVSGSGKVKLRQLVADEVTAGVSGSGDVELGGRTRKLKLSIAGSGDANTQGLEADDVSVSIAGSGDANLTARTSLKIMIAGSGSVVYAGEAVVKTSVAGSGSVRKR